MKYLILLISIFSFLSDLHASELHKAVYNKDLSKAKRLIKEGANLNAKDKWGYTPLHLASSQGDVKFVELFIENKADINIKDSNGQSPLHKAFLYNRKDTFEILLKAGADLEAKDKNGHPPIYMYSGNLAELKKLIKENQFNRAMKYLQTVSKFNKTPEEIERMQENAKNRLGWTDLHKAVYDKNLPKVKILIREGADVNAKDKHGETPLHWASQQGDSKTAEFLIENGADVSAKDKNGQTPLHWASQQGDSKTAEFLIENGTDVNAKDKNGQTPLHWAFQVGSKDLIQVLFRNGADSKAKDNWSNTPLRLYTGKPFAIHKFIKEGEAFHMFNLFKKTKVGDEEKIVKFIKGVNDVNIKDANGNSPLHIAIKENFTYEVTKALIEQGHDINVKDSKGETPVFHAIRNHDPKIAELFLNHEKTDFLVTNEYRETLLHIVARLRGPEVLDILLKKNLIYVNQKDIYGNTPLHEASRNSEVLNMKKLIEKGASVSAKNNSGQTPLHTLIWFGYDDKKSAELLIEKGVNINEQDKHGVTALILSIHQGKIKISKLLIKHNANLYIKDTNGENVFDVISKKISSLEANKFVDSTKDIKQLISLEKHIKREIEVRNSKAKIEKGIGSIRDRLRLIIRR